MVHQAQQTQVVAVEVQVIAQQVATVDQESSSLDIWDHKEERVAQSHHLVVTLIIHSHHQVHIQHN